MIEPQRFIDDLETLGAESVNAHEDETPFRIHFEHNSSWHMLEPRLKYEYELLDEKGRLKMIRVAPA